MEGKKEEITVNNKPVTQEELEQKKEDLKNQPGAHLVEVAKDKYRIKING